MNAEDRFQRCLATVLIYEGGWSNRPQDNGGPTNLGITLPTLSSYLGHTATVAELRLMPHDVVAGIYHGQFWSAVAGDRLPAGIDLFVFDGAVNCGRKRAACWLQHALGVATDGWIGPSTLRALADANDTLLIEDMRQERELYYRGLDDFPTFGSGWLARLDRVSTQANRWLEPALSPPTPGRVAPLAATCQPTELPPCRS